MFVRKILTTVKTGSLQSNQNAACASGSALLGEGESSSSDGVLELRVIHSRNCKSLQVEKSHS